MDSFGVALGLLFASLGSIVYLLNGTAVIWLAALHIIPETVGDTNGSNAAVADGGIEVVLFIEGELLHHRIEDFFAQSLIQRHTHVTQLVLQHGAAS